MIDIIQPQPLDINKEYNVQGKEQDDILAKYNLTPFIPNTSSKASNSHAKKVQEEINWDVKDYGSMVMQGVGNLAKRAGGAIQYLSEVGDPNSTISNSMRSLGNDLSAKGTAINEAYPFQSELEHFEWDDLTTWEGWAKMPSYAVEGFLTSAPEMALTLPIGGFAGKGIGLATKVGSRVASKLGATGLSSKMANKIAQEVIETIGAGYGQATAVGLLEGGDVFKQAIDKGFSREEASEGATDVLTDNIILGIINAPQYANLFKGRFPEMAKQASKFAPGKVGKAVSNVGEVAIQGFGEAGEEVIQRASSDTAMKNIEERRYLEDSDSQYGTVQTLFDPNFYQDDVGAEGVAGFATGAGLSLLGKGGRAIARSIEKRNAQSPAQPAPATSQPTNPPTNPPVTTAQQTGASQPTQQPVAPTAPAINPTPAPAPFQVGSDVLLQDGTKATIKAITKHGATLETEDGDTVQELPENLVAYDTELSEQAQAEQAQTGNVNPQSETKIVDFEGKQIKMVPAQDNSGNYLVETGKKLTEKEATKLSKGLSERFPKLQFTTRDINELNNDPFAEADWRIVASPIEDAKNKQGEAKRKVNGAKVADAGSANGELDLEENNQSEAQSDNGSPLTSETNEDAEIKNQDGGKNASDSKYSPKQKVLDYYGGSYEAVVDASPEEIYESIPEIDEKQAKEIYDQIKQEFEADKTKVRKPTTIQEAIESSKQRTIKETVNKGEGYDIIPLYNEKGELVDTVDTLNLDSSVKANQKDNIINDHYNRLRWELEKAQEKAESAPVSTPKPEPKKTNSLKVGEYNKGFQSVTKALGTEHKYYLPNNEERESQYAVVPLESIQASHNEETFKKTDGFPVLDNGATPNDNDYERNKDAQAKVFDIAQNLNNKVIDNMPIVSSDGIVVSGNNRTMSLKRARKYHKDKYNAYKAELKARAKQFGIDPNAIDSIENPVLVRIDKSVPDYSTDEFKRHNEKDNKSKSPIEQAVIVSKIMTADKAKRLFSLIDSERFSTIREALNDSKVAKALAKALVDTGILGQNDLVQYFDTASGTFNTFGREFIELVAVGAVLDESALRNSNKEGVRQFASVIETSLPMLLALKSNPEFDLSMLISRAIDLKTKQVEGNLSDADVYAQQSIFDDINTERDVAIVHFLMGKGSRTFKKMVDSYHNNAMSGGASLFATEPKKRLDLINEILDFFTKNAKDNDEKFKTRAIGQITRTYEGSQTSSPRGEPDGTRPEKPSSNSQVKTTETKTEVTIGENGKGEKYNSSTEEGSLAGDGKRIQSQDDSKRPKQQSADERSGAGDSAQVSKEEKVKPTGRKKAKALLEDKPKAEPKPEFKKSEATKKAEDELSALFDEFNDQFGSNLNAGIDPQAIILSGKIIAKGAELGFKVFKDYVDFVVKAKGVPFLKSLFDSFKIAYVSYVMQDDTNEEDLNAIKRSKIEDYTQVQITREDGEVLVEPKDIKKELSNPPHRNYRKQSTKGGRTVDTQGGDFLVPVKVGGSFTEQEANELISWIKGIDSKFSASLEGNLIRVKLFGNPEYFDQIPEYVPKEDRDYIDSLDRKEEERLAKIKAQEEELESLPSRDFVVENFSAIANLQNQIAIARYVAGIDKKFDGIVNRTWRDALINLGVNVELDSYEEAMKKVKAYYDSLPKKESEIPKLTVAKSVKPVKASMIFKTFQEAKEWAKSNIARVYTNEETGGKGEIEISKTAIDKFFTESAVSKSEDAEVHKSTVSVLPEIIKESILGEIHPDYIKVNGERKPENGVVPNTTIHRLFGAVLIGNKLYRVKTSVKYFTDSNAKNKTHSYEVIKIELLESSNSSETEQDSRTVSPISTEKLLQGIEKSYEKGQLLLDNLIIEKSNTKRALLKNLLSSQEQKKGDYVLHTPRNSQRDSKNEANTNHEVQQNLFDERGGSGRLGDGTARQAREEGSGRSSRSSNNKRMVASGRGGSDYSLFGKNETASSSQSDAGSVVSERGGATDASGVYAGQQTSTTGGTTAETAFKKLVEENRKKQIEAESIKETKLMDEANIRATLPFLLPEQQDDVLKAEKRFFGEEHKTQERAFGKGMLFTNGTGTGKAQPLDAKVLTPDGWKTMGDISIGDYVISVEGVPTKVLSVHPQGFKKIYKVSFSDGSETECCDEHLWVTQTLYERRKSSVNINWDCAKPKVRPLSEIRETIDKQHFIPIVSPVNFKDKYFVIDPYAMGVILGDGCISQSSIVIANPDAEIIERLRQLIPSDSKINTLETKDKCPAYSITSNERTTNEKGHLLKNSWKKEIESLGLKGANSLTKFIPDSYLFGSINQRVSLLQGLLDTDGYVDKKTKSAYYTTVSENLAKGVIEIVQSLGGIGTFTTKIPKYKHKGKDLTGKLAYTICINLPSEFNPFRLSRKAEAYKPNYKYPARRKITSIDYVGEKEAQCISIDHESHLYVTDNYIVTHNTYTGLGIIKRFIRQGKTNVLIVVPSQPKVKDWVKDGGNLLLDISALNNTKDAGNGIVVTTYANFRANEALLDRDFDLILYDESHRLMESNKGEYSATTYAHMAMSNATERDTLNRLKKNHPLWVKESELYDEGKFRNNLDIRQDFYDRSSDKQKKLETELEAVKKQQAKILPELQARAKKAYENTKVVFLSATPFKTQFNLRYAKNILFSWSEEETYESASNGMSRVNPEARFFLDNFGSKFEWKYHQLQVRSKADPEAIAMQEIAFANKLIESGAMSGRAIESNMDYARYFPLVADEKTDVFNDAYNSLYNYTKDSKYGNLVDFAKDVFQDYNYSTKLLEALRANHAVKRAKEHIKAGRKVVVFHRRKQADITAPFAQILKNARDSAENVLGGKKPKEPAESEATKDEKEKARKLLAEVELFEKENRAVLEYEQTLVYDSAIEQFKQAFGNRVVFVNGDITKKGAKEKAIADFNDPKSDVDVILVQEESGKEGISLHDTHGVKPRALMSLSLPISSITAIQIEGRTYRIGNESNAIFEYPILGLDFEIAHFGQNFNKKLSTTENLAMGDLSRDLLTSFAQGVMGSDIIPESKMDGVGGKALDKRADETKTPFDKAIMVYNSNQKIRGNRNHRQGTDFYPTPEPVGLKMVEWLQLRTGEKALEPSAGRGAIAMWFAGSVGLTAIEPSYDLYSRLLSSTKTEDVRNETFEDLNVINKYHGIAMNPPFGVGGTTAMEHLIKATKHLYLGGRIVALVPDGGAFDKKFDKWYESDESNGFQLTKEIKLPRVTFEQAGTQVGTKILIIDKIGTKRQQEKSFDSLAQPKGKSNVYANTIQELFDEIRNIDVPERSVVKEESEEAPKPEPKKEEKQLFEIQDYEHTQSKKKLVLVKQNGFLDTKVWRRLAFDEVNIFSGSYSKFAKGFLFDTREDAEKFLKRANEIVGNSNPDPDNNPRGRARLKMMFDDASESKNNVRFKLDDTANKPLLAPNGKPSNLTPEQYKQVRTPEFKKWFGDWEKAQLSQFLNGEPVVRLTGNEFAKDGVKLTVKVLDWFKATYNGSVKNPIIGDVVLNEQSIQDSIAHGLGREKSSAFGAVPSIITKGQIISQSKNWKGRGYDSYVISAPFKMGDADYIGTVIVIQDDKTNRFYVHEVAIKEKLQNAFKTGAFANVDRTTGAFGASNILNILHESLNFNSDSVSKVVDENGEPLVVYHGTLNEKQYSSFYSFETNNNMIFFTDNENVAKTYGERLIPAFLNIRNPKTIDFGFDTWDSVIDEYDEVGFELNYQLAKNSDNDGIINKDVYDTGVFDLMDDTDPDYEEPSTIYIAKKPNQIKSATDNTGAFNESNDDIRFQLIGEQGAKNLDKAEEATIRMDNLNVARQMEQSGKDAKAIRLATGWERGADKKWRYEIPDVKAINGLVVNSLPDTVTNLYGRTYTYKSVALKDIVDAKELYDAYPNAENIDIVLYNFASSDGTKGQFTDASEYLGTNPTITMWGIDYSKPLTKKDIGVLTHELQHFVQSEEGFSRGGNSNAVGEGIRPLNPKYNAFIREENQKLVKRFYEIKNSKEYQKQLSESNKLYNEEYDKRIDAYDDIVGESDYWSKVKAVFDEFDNVVKEKFPLIHEADEIAKVAIINEPDRMVSKFETYKRLAGETEARNVEKRASMTPEQRRETLLTETEDVAREDQIILMEGEEVQQSISQAQEKHFRFVNHVKKLMKGWANAPKVNYYMTVDDFISEYPSQAWVKGKNPKGLFFNDEIHVIMDNLSTVEELEETILHESVGHFGLKGFFFDFLMNEPVMDEYNQMMDQIFLSFQNTDLMKKLARLYFDTTPDKAGIRETRVLAEEYIAHMAENSELAPSFMDKLITLIRRMMRKVAGLRLIVKNWSDAEIRTLISMSKAYIANQNGQIEPSFYNRMYIYSHAKPISTPDLNSKLAYLKQTYPDYDQRMKISPFRNMGGTRFHIGRKEQLLAPNGRPSNLTPEQYKQVRTPEFKKWFGDWELMQKKTTITPVDVTQTFPNFKEAEKWAKENIIGSYKNSDTNETITISADSINKYTHASSVFKSSNKNTHLATLRNLPDIVKNAILVEAHSDKNGSPQLEEVQRFYTAIEADNKIQRVKLTVKVYADKNYPNKAYNYEVIEIETLDDKAVDAEQSGSYRASSVSMSNLLKGAKKNNGEVFDTEYSKVVDENGEPLVVYHGSVSKGVTVFDTSLVTKRTDKGDTAGTYFTSDSRTAYNYIFDKNDRTKKGEVKSAFISIKNPLNTTKSITESRKKGVSFGDAKREALKQLNSTNDGIIFDGNSSNSDEYVVFKPNQIKSATENTGLFDAENEDIRFRLPDTGTANEAPLVEYKRFDTAVRYWQDKMIDLKRLQETKRKEGATITDEANPYQTEETHYGRVDAKRRDFERKLVTPFANTLREIADKTGKTYMELSEYLYAKYAPIRNEEIYTKNREAIEEKIAIQEDIIAGLQESLEALESEKILAQTPDEIAKVKAKEDSLKKRISARNGRITRLNKKIAELNRSASGMTDDDAGFIVADMEEAVNDPELLERLHELTKAMTDFTVQTWFDAGLISEDRYNKLIASQYYVPLRGFEEAIDTDATVFSGDLTAYGRKSKAGDVIAYMLSMADTAIIRAEKNKIMQSMVEFVKANPDLRLYKVENVWFVNTGKTDEATGKDIVEATTEKPEGDVVASRDINWETAQVYWRNTDPKKTIRAYYGGRPVVVTFNSPGIPDALSNIGVEKVPQFLRNLAKAMRYLRNTYTQYSPEFSLRNFMRDSTEGFIHLTQDFDAKTASAIVNPVRLGGIMKGMRQIIRNKSYAGEWASWYKRFEDAGGRSGMWQLDDVATHTKQMQKLVHRTAEKNILHMTANGFNKFLQLVEDYNAIVENAVRVSTFRYLIENKGFSEAQSASYSKNLTVNFNRKGNGSSWAGTLYLFFNAGVQGNARLIKPFRSDNASIRRKAIMTPLLMAGSAFMWAEVIRMVMGAGDDEEDYLDKQSTWMLTHNILIPNILSDDEDDFLRIPLPYGYNTYWALGMIMNQMAHGVKSMAETAFALSDVAMGSFSPIGGLESDNAGVAFSKFVAPTLMDPVLELSMNENFAGSPIYREQFTAKHGIKKLPNSHVYYDSANDWIVDIAKYLNKLSGGNEVESGLVDISPEVIEYLIGQVTGGTGQFIMKSLDFMRNVADGDAFEGDKIRKVPFLSSLMTDTSPYIDIKRFYENFNKLQEKHIKYRAYLEIDPTKANQYFMDNKEDLIEYYKAKPIIGLFKDERDIDAFIKSGKMGEEATNPLNTIKKNMVTDFNRKNNRARKLRSLLD